MRTDASSFSAASPRGVAFALSLAVCACWYPKERGERLEQRLDRVDADAPARQPAADAAARKEAEQRMEAQLAALQKRLDALAAQQQQQRGDAGAKPSPDAAARLDRITEELQHQRATLDAQTRRLDGLERTVARAEAAPRDRPAERRATRAPSPPAAPQSVAPAPSPAASGELPKDKAGVLALARQQEAQGRKEVARDLYEQYAASFPADPGAAEAHYRLGELAYGDKRFQDAIGEYGKVARDFPRSGQAPDALLKSGESMLRLGLKEEAASVLSEVPKRYPGTPSASRARQRLAELGAAAPAR